MVERPSDAEENVARERRVNRVRNVAVVGLRDSRGKILMTRTSRLPSRWQPIGGGMEPQDRSPVDALVREVAEECGFKLSDEELEPVIETPYDFGQGTVYFYEARYDDTRHVMTIDEAEIVEWRWCDLAEARALPVFPATAKFLEVLDR